LLCCGHLRHLLGKRGHLLGELHVLLLVDGEQLSQLQDLLLQQLQLRHG
jgi:hypothetical protein